eukprot:2268257-Rhodomonas_salina.2
MKVPRPALALTRGPDPRYLDHANSKLLAIFDSASNNLLEANRYRPRYSGYLPRFTGHLPGYLRASASHHLSAVQTDAGAANTGGEEQNR